MTDEAMSAYVEAAERWRNTINLARRLVAKGEGEAADLALVEIDTAMQSVAEHFGGVA